MTFQIRPIQTLPELEGLLSAGLSDLYIEIFKQPPYWEHFSPSEIHDQFVTYLTAGLLFVATEGERPIGFGACMPLAAVPDVQQALAAAGWNKPEAWYMASLGTKSSFRRQGLARSLVLARLRALPPDAWVVMRTSSTNDASQALYTSLGFCQIHAAAQRVNQQSIDGSMDSYTRVFFYNQAARAIHHMEALR